MRQNHQKKAGTSVIFLNSAGWVLLYLRDLKNEIPFPNCWDLLGGHVEPGESPEECIKREIAEEIEMELDQPPLFKVYDFDDRIEYTFWKRADLDIGKLKLNEGQRLKWFSEDDIRQLTDKEIAFNFRTVLLEFYQERPWTRPAEPSRRPLQ